MSCSPFSCFGCGYNVNSSTKKLPTDNYDQAIQQSSQPVKAEQCSSEPCGRHLLDQIHATDDKSRVNGENQSMATLPVVPPIPSQNKMLRVTKRGHNVIPQVHRPERPDSDALQVSGMHLPNELTDTSTVPNSNENSSEKLYYNARPMDASYLGVNQQSVTETKSSTQNTQGSISAVQVIRTKDTLPPMPQVNQSEKAGKRPIEMSITNSPRQRQGNPISRRNQEKSDSKFSKRNPEKVRIKKLQKCTDHNPARNRSYHSQPNATVVTLNELKYAVDKKEDHKLNIEIHRSRTSAVGQSTVTKQNHRTRTADKKRHVSSGATSVCGISPNESNNYTNGSLNAYDHGPCRTPSATTGVLREHTAKQNQTDVSGIQIEKGYHGDRGIVNRNQPECNAEKGTNLNRRPENPNIHHRDKPKNDSNINSFRSTRTEQLTSSVAEFKDDTENQLSTADQKNVPNEQMYSDGVQSPLPTHHTEKEQVTPIVYAEDGQSNATVDDVLLHDPILQSFTINNQPDVDNPEEHKINSSAAADERLDDLGLEIQAPKAATQINKKETARAKRRKSKEQDHRHVSSKPPLKTTPQHAKLVPGREDQQGGSAKAEQIGYKVDVLKYVAKEWRSDTAIATVMKKGYHSVYHDYDLHHIQVIKGDNYCAIRSVIYQVLVDGRIQLLENLGAKDDIAQKLQVFQESGEYGLHKWSFGNNIKLHKRNSVYDQVQLCVQQLFALTKKMSEADDREKMLFSYFNNSYDADVEIMEAVKILMMLKAIDLHEKMLRDEHPMFVIFMFARDTSETLQLLFKNHINKVGDTGGLEQVEMILLAHTLGINIVVFRLKSINESDFRTEFNDESENLMAINIVAEDDRHYNILR